MAISSDSPFLGLKLKLSNILFFQRDLGEVIVPKSVSSSVVVLWFSSSRSYTTVVLDIRSDTLDTFHLENYFVLSTNHLVVEWEFYL